VIALLLFAIALCLSLAIGLAAYAVLQRQWPLWIKIPASVILSLVSMVIAACVFLYGALSYVATDETPYFLLGSDSDSAKPNDITLHVSQPGVSGEIYLIRLEFPKYVSRGDDFTIHLQITPSSLFHMPNNLEATIRAANTIKFWNSLPCETDKSNGSKSCGSLGAPAKGVDYYWNATASDEGERTITVVYPPLELPMGWTTTVSSNNKMLLPCGIYHMDHCSRMQPDVLSADHPTAKHANIGRDVVERHPPWFRLDMSARSFTFPVKVILGLGVASATYQWLSIAGLAISGALGSGWAVKLFELLRKNPSARTHEPFRPKGSGSRGR
jgi:hypothetical protein